MEKYGSCIFKCMAKNGYGIESETEILAEYKPEEMLP